MTINSENNDAALTSKSMSTQNRPIWTRCTERLDWDSGWSVDFDFGLNISIQNLLLLCTETSVEYKQFLMFYTHKIALMMLLQCL